MKISQFLIKENNNLDLIRILLASLVILGHTIAINGDTHHWVDPVQYIFPFTYSGALSVKLFFFISGLVVTNSYLNKNSLIYFIISRAFRLLPALIFLLLITVFIIGPVFTSNSLSEYFSGLNNLSYIRNNVIFNTEHTLPGVFTKNLYLTSINGSLWSLHYEVECYFFLMLIFLFLGNKKRFLFNLAIGVILIGSFLPPKLIFGRHDINSEIYYLPFSFAYGVFLAINSDKIKINSMIIILSFLAYLVFRNTNYQELFLITAFSNLIIFISSQKFILHLKPKYDISYGIYLWGFLMQQIVYFMLGQVYAGLHFIIAWLLSVILGYVSFVLIEKPFMNLGRQVYNFIELKREKISKN